MICILLTYPSSYTEQKITEGKDFLHDRFKAKRNFCIQILKKKYPKHEYFKRVVKFDFQRKAKFEVPHTSTLDGHKATCTYAIVYNSVAPKHFINNGGSNRSKSFPKTIESPTNFEVHTQRQRLAYVIVVLAHCYS